MTTPAKSSALHHMVGHASIYAAGNIMRQLVGFLMLPVYTSCLSPADFGVVSLMIFALSLIEPFFGARLGLAIPKYYADAEKPSQKASVVSTAIFTTGLVSILSAAVLIFLRRPISLGLLGSDKFEAVVGLFAMLLVTQILENYALIYIRLQQRPWLFVFVNLLKLIIQLSLNIWLVVFQKMGVLGVAISSMSSSGIFAIILICYTLQGVGFGFNKNVAIKMVQFCWPLWLSGLAGLYIGSSSRFYMKIYSSLDDIGLYELALKFSAIISVLLWEPFQQYWQIEQFEIYKFENANILFNNVFVVLSNVLVICAIGVVIFSGPVINIMSSVAFHSASCAVPFLTIGGVFSCLASFCSFNFFITEKTRLITLISYFTAAVVTIFYFVFIPNWGYVGAALALSLAQFVSFVTIFYFGRQFFDMNISLFPIIKFLLIYCFVGYVATILIVGFSPFFDMVLRLILYFFSIVFVIYPLWKNRDTRIVLQGVMIKLVNLRAP